jgi:ParB-like chromosome segregation protein Spo0J
VGEDGGLIAGHARILAARQLGIANIPVMVAAGWSEAQKRAYVLADNQLAITGSGWDPELLRLELGELKLSGFDLSLTGFGDLELKDLLAERTEGLTDPDDTPAVPEHRVGPCIFRIRDQPVDRPALDLVGRPRPLISGRCRPATAETS